MNSDNTSEAQLTIKPKNNYHHIDKDGLISERPCDKSSMMPTIDHLYDQQYSQIHIKYSTEEIVRKFNEFMRRKNFRSIKSFQNELLLVERTISAKVKRLVSCLIPRFKPKLLRFWVQTDEYKSARIIQLASLNREEPEDITLKHILKQFAHDMLPEPQVREDLQDQPQDLYSLEATSKYMFSKMLLEQGYSMGQKTRAFLDKIGKHNLSKNVQTPLVRWVQEMKNQMVQDLLRGFNCSRKELTQILPFCRSTIEEFLYTRVFLDDGLVVLMDLSQSHFRNTIREIEKLHYVVSPAQLLRTFFWISEVYQQEYSTSGQRRQTLQQLIKKVRPRNIVSKVQILRAYQAIMGDCFVWKSSEAVMAALT